MDFEETAIICALLLRLRRLRRKQRRMTSQYDGEGDSMEEGQEEWLSEGVLTDDDYNNTVDPEHSDSNNASHDNTAASVDNAEFLDNSGSQELNQDDDEPKPKEMNIEETLNNLETGNIEIPDDLDAFLIRKSESNSGDGEMKDEKLDDDGNDTDDLLRMLGEDDEKVKKKVIKRLKDKKAEQEAQSSEYDDDDFIYEGAKVKTLKVAKNALIRKYPAAKAEPEEMSDGDDESDESSNEVRTMKNMFGVSMKKNNVASKSTAKSSVMPRKPPLRQVARVADKEKPSQQHNKVQTKSILKSATPIKSSKSVDKKSSVSFKSEKTSASKSADSKSAETNLKIEPMKWDEIINEEEFLDEEEFDLDEEEFAEDSEMDLDTPHQKQSIMKPEEMDEEVPTDGESQSEDGSLYDELPSSDSDDLEDWFTLDIRAERAGDYLPLLGSKAHELLLEEKRRVADRLTTLRQNLTAMTDSGRKQAEQLREATVTLAELDDMLKAS